MPKTPSNKLFNLIKSMSGSEKRYFKVFVGSHANKNSKYLRLFDAIEAQEEFDDEVLKNEVYQGEPVQSRKYSELKAYLYDLCLKSLQGYDEKTSVDYKLRHYLQSMQVLFRRSLFSDCQDLLGKARKLAYKYERFTVLIDMLGWEKQLAYAKSDIDYLDEALDRIDTEEQHLQQQLSSISAYRNLFFRLLVSLRKDASLAGPEFRKRLANIVDTPLLQKPPEGDAHQAQIYYYRTLSIYQLAIGDLQAFKSNSEQLIELMESKPHFLDEDVSEYISALSNLIMGCGRVGDYDALEIYLEKLRQVKPLSQDDELKIHRQYYQNKFSLCIAKGDFKEGLSALKTHLRERSHFDNDLFETNTFYYYYFHISFGAEAYDDALSYLNDWLNLSTTVERQELQGTARILNLIVHFELGNYVLLDSLIRSTYRYLKKREQLHDVERETISFIRKATGSPSKHELKAAYENLKGAFEQLPQAERAKSFFVRAFDMMAWLEGKLEGKSYGEMIKRKFKERSR
ncbi:hypothetical protein [Phaeodactylibacter sp.]|jgi:hypothetical protein|uniref:hypothetical protein n=1 Tax=Phaeodactylibacter sp. TaxID=1940289 RepID=UPI0025DDB594|nr:hypothetical protein [Phaeodactylibacter sp.]MCI4649771.1 hypothetical protein [Phaeodactylibacter sp.]MCI5092982.1 hypothetical protein [Phaeodactylibacter sp.]